TGRRSPRLGRVGFSSRIPARRWTSGLDVSRSRSRAREERPSSAFAKHGARQLPSSGRRKTGALGIAPGVSFSTSRSAGRRGDCGSLQAYLSRRAYEIAAPRGRALPTVRVEGCDCALAFTILAKKLP